MFLIKKSAVLVATFAAASIASAILAFVPQQVGVLSFLPGQRNSLSKAESLYNRWGILSPLSSTSDSSTVANSGPSGSTGSSPNRRNGEQRQRQGGGPPRRPGGGPRKGRNFQNRGGQRHGTGGGGPAQLKLENPLKVQKIAVPPLENPLRIQKSKEDNTGGRQQVRSDRGGRAAASASVKPKASPIGATGSESSDHDVDKRRGRGYGVDVDIPDPSADKGPRRQPGGGKATKVRKDKKDFSEVKPKRPSLRLGTGKRGRAAEGIMQRRSSLKKRDRLAEKEEKLEKALQRRTVRLPDEPLTVGQLAEILEEKPVAVVKYLMTDLGVMASVTQVLDPSTCAAVAEGFGKIVASSDEEEEDYEDDDEKEESVLSTGLALDEDDPEDLVPRPPVVTIMGHVDHGKTTLLDTIRNTRVTAGEAGGITQHIGAYQVEHEGSKITFIDTPGHAAFTDMRERGANITDIVILVVAADDGVKQQTADSIACARQAGVPIVVAINKCDLPTADPNRVKSDLTGYDVLAEDLGGDVLFSEISAKEGTNLDDLLSKVMLQAEIQELKANPNREAQGVVVEARVEKGLGTVATTLIQKGTLKIGDSFVAGETYGRIRALIASDGKTRVQEVGPSTPVSVVGFDGIPAAGVILVVTDEQTARELAENRQRLARERESASYQSGLMQSVAATFGGSGLKERRELCVVIKADVQGSAEALSRALTELKMENEEAIVKVKVLVSEAGEVSKSDIAVASVTPGTIVLAFNTAANFGAMEDARAQGIPIEYYSVVYDAIDSIESRMQEVLSPTPEGEYVGAAVVQEVFDIGGIGKIAGSRCTDGYIRKGSNVRVLRGDKILTESKIKTLRNFKADVDQIDAGNECGINLVEFEAFEPGDVIESFVVR